MHLWIIMDWNRRWAKSKMLPTLMWHKAWFENAVKIIRYAWKIPEISHLTLWALSKENLVKRDALELAWIIKLIEKLQYLLPELQENNIKFETIWDIEKLPETSQKVLQNVKNETKNNTGMILIAAFVYSGQDEIIRAIKKIFSSWIDINSLDEKWFKKFLDTRDFPAPDLIIRTGWDIRHSGFMLYDSDYSEYYFTQKLWPDFDEQELEKAIDFLQWSKRNFGK